MTNPLGVSAVRGLAVVLKLVVSAPFQFVSDDPLGVSGCSRRSRACRDAKSDDLYSGRGVS